MVKNSERILEFVGRFPGTDDDEISAALQITPRQTVNQVARALSKAGALERRPNLTGKLGNYPVNRPGLNFAIQSSDSATRDTESLSDVTKEWFWEGNVTDAVVKYLGEQGWKILAQADTKSKERGLDIHATRGNREIMVEAKGYPSQSYRDPSRAGERKPTSPTLQAQHWYSHAMLKAMRLHSAHPSATVAVALPDFPRYRKLFQETKSALLKLKIAVLFVSKAGGVDAIGLEGQCLPN